MRANTYDVIEKIVAQEGVSAVLFALMAVMNSVAEETEFAFNDKKLSDKWFKGVKVIRKAISELPKAHNIK